MKIRFPKGTRVSGHAFSHKTLCLDISLPVPPDGVPKYDEDDEDWPEDERPGLTLEIDCDDVSPREVQYALQRLVDDLGAAGWVIHSVYGEG